MHKKSQKSNAKAHACYGSGSINVLNHNQFPLLLIFNVSDHYSFLGVSRLLPSDIDTFQLTTHILKYSGCRFSYLQDYKNKCLYQEHKLLRNNDMC